MKKQVYEYEAEVVRVVDGDTVVLNVDLGFKTWLHKLTCRLAGINAPEMNTEAGPVASGALAGLLIAANASRGTVRIVSRGLDKYGRWLVTIYGQDGCSLNEKMMMNGHAVEAK